VTYNPQAPKHEKIVHHVVPRGWQRRFFPTLATGQRASAGHYKDILSGKIFGPVGPGEKMAEDFANIVFDEFFRPSDALEDRLSFIEARAIPALDRIVQNQRIEPGDRVDIAMLLGLQAARYPQSYGPRLDLCRLFAVALGDAKSFSDAQTFNGYLETNGLKGAPLTEEDFRQLLNSEDDKRPSTIDALLKAHGYEHFFNPGLVIDSTEKIAGHILALEWHLIKAGTPSFILSDTPMPNSNLGYSFRVSLTDCFALWTAYPATPVGDDTVAIAQLGTPAEISAVNVDMRARALRYLCGPETF
jgi:hypothetical protein